MKKRTGNNLTSRVATQLLGNPILTQQIVEKDGILQRETLPETTILPVVKKIGSY